MPDLKHNGNFFPFIWISNLELWIQIGSVSLSKGRPVRYLTGTGTVPVPRL